MTTIMAPGTAVGGAQKPMQRPGMLPTLSGVTRPDAIRPPQGGPGTAAPPVLSAKPQQPAASMPVLQSGGQAPQAPRPQYALPQGGQMPVLHGAQQPGVNPTLPGLGGNPLNPSGNPVPLGQVGDMIQRQLANPSRFDMPAFKQAFDYGRGELEAEAARSRQDVTADAARRGVFHSTAPDTMTGGHFDIGERFNRGLGGLASNLLLEQARTGASDFNSAMGNAFRFMENQQGADQFAAQLGLNATNLGFQGAPDINQILGGMSGQPLPQLGRNPLEAFGSTLGTFYGQRKNANG